MGSMRRIMVHPFVATTLNDLMITMVVKSYIDDGLHYDDDNDGDDYEDDGDDG